MATQNATTVSYFVSQIDCNGDSVDGQLLPTEIAANAAYAVIGASTTPADGAELVELWAQTTDDVTGQLVSRTLVAYRPLVPGAVCPYIQAREYVDNELAGISLDLQSGMAQITDALTGSTIANETDINTVIAAVQQKLTTAQASNSRAINSVVTQAQQAMAFHLTPPLADPNAPGTIYYSDGKTVYASGTMAGLWQEYYANQTTSDILPPVANVAAATGQVSAQTAVAQQSTSTASCDYYVQFDANYIDGKDQMFHDAQSAWNYANQILAAHGTQFGQINNDGLAQLVAGNSIGQGTVGNGYGTAYNAINVVCQQSQTAPTSTPTASPSIPVAGAPIPQTTTVTPAPTQQVPAQCPSCGCIINVTAPVTVVGAGGNNGGQNVSPVVDWDDAFAGVSGLLTQDQINRVRTYLDPLTPNWDYASLMDSIKSAQQPALPAIA
jgi:hypothetical protein